VDRTRPLHSAAAGEVCWFFASPTSPSGRYRLVALTPSTNLFICAKYLFVKPRQDLPETFLERSGAQHTLMPHMGSFLADQQKKQSGSYQHGKQNTDDKRKNRMPIGRRF
jgi:hypothetical protein